MINRKLLVMISKATDSIETVNIKGHNVVLDG